MTTNPVSVESVRAFLQSRLKGTTVSANDKGNAVVFRIDTHSAENFLKIDANLFIGGADSIITTFLANYMKRANFTRRELWHIDEVNGLVGPHYPDPSYEG